MKLPNGYGSITKLKGNRRRPFMVRISEDNSVRRVLGYFATKEEALIALTEYNQNPYDLTKKSPTFSEVFGLWLKDCTLAESTKRTYISKYNNYCKSLYDIPYKDITLQQFRSIVNETQTPATRNKLVKFLRSLGRTALENDIVTKDYTQFLKTVNENAKEKIPFSEEEIELLWNNIHIKDVDYILIHIYTGFRPDEFIHLRRENIDLENNIIIGGGKTRAGTNRRVPIHPRIKPLIKEKLKDDRKTLFRLSYKTYNIRFKKVMNLLKMTHTPHDCRHTLRTRLDNLDINSVIIDRIMGHSSGKVGQDVYTHKTIEQLKEAINMLN